MPTLLHPPVPASGARQRWHQLYGSARSLALAEAVETDTRPYLVIARDARELDQLRSELAFFLGGSRAIHVLPDWEVLPYDLFSPHPDIISERLAALAEMPNLKSSVLLAAADTLGQKIAPRGYVDGRTFNLTVGDKLPIEPLRARLVESGYAAVSQVSAPGEFALRGSLFDVFPMGAETPLRVDLFDQEIEAIREFDPDTQRSGKSLKQVRLLPGRELPLDADSVKAFRLRYRKRFEGDPTRSVIYRSVSDGLAPPGIEFYLPLFFDATDTLLDYLPKDTVVCAGADLPAAVERAATSIADRYEERRHDVERPVLAPDELYLPPDELQARLDTFTRIDFDSFKIENAWVSDGLVGHNFATAAPQEWRVDLRAERPLAPLETFLDTFPGRVLLAADSAGRREVLLEMLRAHGLKPEGLAGWHDFVGSNAPFALCVAPEMAGLNIVTPPIAVLGEAQLFGQRARQERRRRRAQSDPQAILRDLTALGPGSPVVHEEYGVGRYIGLQVMQVAGQDGEFVVLEYAGGDKLYVPVQQLHLVSRYSGAAPESAPLHKLGTDQWAKARKRAADKIRDVAAELLDLYAQRQAKRGPALPQREVEYQAFASSFPFEETADQAEAIRQVLQDLASEKPMDRVVCGDVGFGKTEVAMRAAFVAAQAGKQVAVLVPTTLLAEQHTNNFRDRFADWPIRIESLSRFRTGKESNAVLEGIERGTVDIVIATHRLLHANVRFKDLGLVIVDEEHRFGVRDKEKLKTLRAEVHVLTLTATPIPRTLNMALGGLRDLSLITTPPAERLAIKTFVTEWHAPTLREAALREFRRGGQVYFVHNVVESIEKTAQELAKLIPEAEVRVGHGQMRERDLEQLMVDFYHRRFNMLVCTTIIESGIDVPTANTIMIDRADKLGLAQLHQLRGRVGRSHHRAYAYLLTPPRKALSLDAVKRLEAIESLEELGAGFVLATHDLEIRGAGELLGESQSGELTEIGLTLYLDLLEQAVKAMKEGREPNLDRPLAATAEVELRLPALLPESYVADVPVRLGVYKRLAAAPDNPAIDLLTEEIVDRFGPLPPPAMNLLRVARLKLAARAIGIRRLDLGPQGGYALFEEQNQVDPRAVIRLVQHPDRDYRLEGALKLRISVETDEAERFEFAEVFLNQLKGTPVVSKDAARKQPDPKRPNH
ncbi:MAG TPA: transcription-repair coupling factor [Steroidobacteraceae bacterium]|jgi:transcription-repair coupling factor (superfamily II helicase)|nr:transcription-repair coupling factor [Steroidobacteraceae bacterium]